MPPDATQTALPANTTHEPPVTSAGWNKRVWFLAAPIILSNVTVPLVGAVDTAIVGHLDEVELIGAVALGASIFSLVFWTFGFLRMGVGGVIAQASGAGDHRAVTLTLQRSLLIAMTIGVVILCLQKPLLALCVWMLGASDSLAEYTTLYYSIRVWSAPATLANYVVLGALIGVQKTGKVFVVQLFLNLTNIALDLLFVPWLHMGISGVALASVIAEYSALAFGLYLLHSTITQPKPRDTAALQRSTIAEIMHYPALRRLFVINTNIFIRTLLLVLSFFYFNAVSTRLGPVALAANAILLQLLNICAYALDGFAHAVETLTGHAWGKRNKQDFTRAVYTSTLQSAVVALLLTMLLALFGNSILQLFTSQNNVLIQASDYLPWAVALPTVAVWCYQLDGIFIGTTHTVEMRNAMIISSTLFVAVAELLLPYGNHALWGAFLFFMLLRAMTLLAYYPRITRSMHNRR